MKKFILKNPAILFASFVPALLLPGPSFSQFFLEDFSTAVDSTPPAGWSWQTSPSGVGADTTTDIWYFDDPGGKNPPLPISGNAAIYDNDYNDCQAGCAFGSKNAVLFSRIFDASILDTVLLSWDQTYQIGNGVGLTVEAYNGSIWNILWDTLEGAVGAGILYNQSRIFDISSIVAGVSNAQLRFTIDITTSAGILYWIIDNVNIGGTCPTPAVADFTADTTQGCDTLPLTVNFTNSSTGATAWNWTFPGGTPPNSITQNQTVTYNTPGIYDVTLTASGCGNSTMTKAGYITVDSCIAPSGINELIGFESLSISPNPTTGSLNITFDVNELKPTSIKIYNVIGGLITEISQPNGLLKGDYNFDLAAQPDGAYFVTVESGDRVVTRKVVIIGD